MAITLPTPRNHLCDKASYGSTHSADVLTTEYPHRSFLACLVLMLVLAGCTSPDAEPLPAEESSFTITTFPNWNGTTHLNESLNHTAMENTAYMAYFSTPWCTHCESTINVYEQVIPPGQLVIFSKEEGEQYANMTQWHEQLETNLNRTIDRPVILNLALAEEIGVVGIPHAVYINSQGYVHQVVIGKQDNLTHVQNTWEATATALFDPLTGWNQSS